MGNNNSNGYKKDISIYVIGTDSDKNDVKLQAIKLLFGITYDDNIDNLYNSNISKLDIESYVYNKKFNYELIDTIISKMNSNFEQFIINNLIICFINNNDILKEKEELLCNTLNDKITNKIYFPLILFVYDNKVIVNKEFKNCIFDYTYIYSISLEDSIIKKSNENVNNENNKDTNIDNNTETNIDSNSNNKDNNNKIPKKEEISNYIKDILLNYYIPYFNNKGFNILEDMSIYRKINLSRYYFPILLLGNTKSGKSRYINIQNGKQILKENYSTLPLEKEIQIVDLEIPNITKELDACIRYIEIPEKFNNINKLDKIKELFSEAKNNKEIISVALFMFDSRKDDIFNNKEDIEIIKYLYRNKVMIIYVANYVEDINKFDKRKIACILDDNDISNTLGRQLCNIMPINLNNNITGIDNIYKEILCFNRFNGIEIFNDGLIKKLSQLSTFEEKLDYIKMKTHFFNEISSKNDIENSALKKTNLIIGAAATSAGAAGLIPIPFLDFPILISALISEIYKIADVYGYSADTIKIDDFKSILKGEKYKEKKETSIKDFVNSENATVYGISFLGYGLETGMITLEPIFMEVFKQSTLVNAGSITKFVPVIGTVLGAAISVGVNAYTARQYGNYTKDYFESKFKATNGEDYFITRVNNYKYIFRQMNDLQN